MRDNAWDMNNIYVKENKANEVTTSKNEIIIYEFYNEKTYQDHIKLSTFEEISNNLLTRARNSTKKAFGSINMCELISDMM